MGSFIQNIQPEKLCSLPPIICCNLLLYAMHFALPKGLDWADDVPTVTLSSLPMRKWSENDHFLSEPLCLQQPSFLPSLHITYLPPTMSSSCPFLTPVWSPVAWTPEIWCIATIGGSLWDSNHTVTQGQVGSGWVQLASHILAGGA